MTNKISSNQSSSGKSRLDYKTLFKSYRELKRQLLTKATDQDITNLIMILGKNTAEGASLTGDMAKLVTAFAVAALSEEGIKRDAKKKRIQSCLKTNS